MVGISELATMVGISAVSYNGGNQKWGFSARPLHQLQLRQSVRAKLHNGGNPAVSYNGGIVALATMVAINEQHKARISYNGSNAIATMLTLSLSMEKKQKSSSSSSSS